MLCSENLMRKMSNIHKNNNKIRFLIENLDKFFTGNRLYHMTKRVFHLNIIYVFLVRFKHTNIFFSGKKFVFFSHMGIKNNRALSKIIFFNFLRFIRVDHLKID